jgi:predicted dinucleotide-binding enzyme
MDKRIGIIGSGVVAKALGAGFLKYGYKVMLGTRDAKKLTEWTKNMGKGVQVGSFAEAAAFGNIVVLATKGTACESALEMAGAGNLNGKTIIDTTNPIAEVPPENGVIKFFTRQNESLMELLQNTYPDARFVKAFNSIGNAFMVDPQFESRPTMFICGNHKEAKAEVKEILHQFGWETADFGGVESARAIEPLCMLWCIPGMLNNEWSHAFKLLKL